VTSEEMDGRTDDPLPDWKAQSQRHGTPPALPSISPRSRAAAIVAKQLLRVRRTRDETFGPDAFGEPAWDLMLTLYVAKVEGMRLGVSAACDASAAPFTTGLRWIERLTERGLIHRRARPGTARRWLELDDDATRRLERVLLDR
jgi:hypothetical protein